MVGKDRVCFIIDKLREEDLPEVVAIEELSFSLPWSRISFFNEIYNPRSIPMVARVEGRIAGFICARQILDEGHIYDLAVHPEFRRQGIATALVNYIIKHFKENDCRFVYLEVRVSNEIALKMYEKIGFKTIGTRKDYYKEPVEDAIVMSLKLRE